MVIMNKLKYRNIKYGQYYFGRIGLKFIKKTQREKIREMLLKSERVRLKKLKTVTRQNL